MVELTPKQRAVFEWSESGRTAKDGAASLGISVPVFNKTLVVARRKLGITAAVGHEDRKAKREELNLPEVRLPEKAAELIDVASDPEAKLRHVRAVAERLGMPKAMSDAVIRRLATKWLDMKQELRALKTGEILLMIEQRLGLAGLFLDEKVMAEASARDLMLGMSALIEKRQLLRGEPTAIVSDLERKRLNELLPLAIAEAQRRGLTLQGQVTERVVGPA